MPKLKNYRELEKIARKPKYANGWLRSALEYAYTQQEWVEIFRGLPPAVQIKTLVDLQPKEIKQELASTFRLVLEGMPVQKQLQEYMNETVDNSEDDQ